MRVLFPVLLLSLTSAKAQGITDKENGKEITHISYKPNIL